jgi:ParB family protein of integrating conjugative element (PFGI_1 class)
MAIQEENMTPFSGTFMTVPLDKLRAFDLNPRIIRNPDYDEIKASIRNQGLKFPPQITRRPGEDYYIIASGGNTRLAILNELWLETQDKKYRDVSCIYQPWQEDQSMTEGNLHCLLDHLIENEMRGSLTFIEQALGVRQMKELYHALGRQLSQTQLARQLCDDGFPVTQSSISRMESAVDFLLPHIPDVLYGGLSRKSVQKILLLRTSAEQFWYQHSADRKHLPAFDDIFALALIPFNGPLASFSIEHLQDELAGLISKTLDLNYNSVILAIDLQNQKRRELLGLAIPALPPVEQQRICQPPSDEKKPEHQGDSIAPPQASIPPDTGCTDEASALAVSRPASEPDNATTHQVQPAPVMYPAADLIWTIDPMADSPQHLASVVDQLAWELAGEMSLEFLISPDEQQGFDLTEPETPLTDDARIYFRLLAFLAGKMTGSATLWHQLLIGNPTRPAVLGDTTVIRMFRLVRTLRRLHEKQQGVT